MPLKRIHLQKEDIIDPVRAKQIIDQYVYNPYIHILEDPSNTTSPMLQSWEFDIDSLNTSASGSYLSVYLALGHHQTTATNGLRQGYTLIAFPMDSGDNVIFNSNTIYDALIQQNGTNLPVTNAQASSAMSYYLNNHPILLPGETQYNGKNAYKGFVIQSHEIKKLKINGASRVRFILGYHTANSRYFNVGYTCVMYGVNSSGMLMDSEQDDIFDYCHPCPTKCPSNI